MAYTNQSFQQDFLHNYRNLREIAESHVIVLSEFDRAYAEHLCSFDPVIYIASGGVIPLDHSIRSLIATSQDVSTFCEDKASSLVGHPDNELWERLSTTFWNPFVEKTLNGLLLRMSSHKTPKDMPMQQQPHQATKKVKPKTNVLVYDRERLKAELQNVRSRSNILHTKVNPCEHDNCENCQQIFDNMPLTDCKVIHSAKSKCVPTGWYPHVSKDLWRSLRRAHDKPSFEFVPRSPKEGERANPLRTKAYRTFSTPVASNEPIAQEPQASTSVQAPDAGARSPTYLPDGYSDKTQDWVTIVDDEIGPVGTTQRSPNKRAAVFVPARRKLKQARLGIGKSS